MFYQVSWGNKQLFALCQAALIEKFVDVLLWLFYPILLVQRGFSLTQAALVTSVYAVIWGIFQLFTSTLSDFIGRVQLIMSGMLCCSLGLLLQIWIDGVISSIVCAFIIGLGMAMLYPTLGAAVSDLCEIEWRKVQRWESIDFGVIWVTLSVHFSWERSHFLLPNIIIYCLQHQYS